MHSHGIATGCDTIFIAPPEQLPIEASRTLPLLIDDMHASQISWPGRVVINPFEASGTLVDPARSPRLNAYLLTEAVRRQKTSRVLVSDD